MKLIQLIYQLFQMIKYIFSIHLQNVIYHFHHRLRNEI